MKLRTTARLCAFFIPFLTLFSSCIGQNRSDETAFPPSLHAPSTELPSKTPFDPPSDVPDVPDAPLTPLPDMIDGVWNLSDVDVSGISPKRKLIAFTYDDAPSKTLENIFAVYADYNESHPDAPAFATVFFNSVRFDEQTPHLLATAHALRFELGNHTHSHYDLTTLSEQALREEIDKTDAELCKIDGKERHLLRAPFGKVNALVRAIAPTPLIDWTIDTMDWSGVSEESVYHSVFDNRFSGAIVLMHDGYEHTVEALKRLLPDLYEDGYQVVSVSQLAKMHGCTLCQGKVYIRARNQNVLTTSP